MSDHYVNYERQPAVNAHEKLIDIIKDIGPEDELVITMDAFDADQSGYIFDILEEHGFEVLPKGSNEGNQYHIVAHRKKRHKHS
ncbi:MAG: hypothetical protein K0R93_3741 [Anaerosolibacter sp.]|uniref:hypothetical protein n=1 Tax=Anaerosolibacter sp. TaxID=1872527 RepID=UPI00261C04D5|nr:hypothetical protein [Anaerosolibacter sp.]MDF2548843.1 hypothetical protein [Anaerosolibacter sp.]